MTHELIANMLGVRREGITVAASKLQRAGNIDYHRGHITLLDRSGLEARVCERYQVVKAESERLLSPLACPTNTATSSGMNSVSIRFLVLLLLFSICASGVYSDENLSISCRYFYGRLSGLKCNNRLSECCLCLY